MNLKTSPFKSLTIFVASACASSFMVGSKALAVEGDSGFFLEPGVTYELGKTKTNYNAWSNGILGDSTGDANGLGLVGRAGFHINDAFFVALDARYAFLTFKDSSNNLSSDAASYSLAPMVGAQMPNLGLRAWIGYVAAAQLDPKQSGEYDFKFKDGTGFLIGGGFHVGIVSLNLEYKNVKYGSTDFEHLPLGFSQKDSSVTAEDQSWIASVTFPMAL